MKNEYQRVKEEISAAVQRVHEAEALQSQQENDCRKRYEEAQNAMSAALAAGDREGYKTAGLAAEAARLDLEFFKKSKALNQTPTASLDDDRRIRAVLSTEANLIRIDYLNQLKDLFTQAATLCEDTKKKLDEIDMISDSWNKTVMKKANAGRCYPDEVRMAIGQFANAINGQLQKFTFMKGV